MNLKYGADAVYYRYIARLPSKQRIQKEITRKILHISVAFSVLLAHLVGSYTVAVLLFLGSLVYFVSELLRIQGINIPYITDITNMSRRNRDKEQSITWGPITLAIGSMACFLTLPLHYASVGVLALAFGDGLASLVGVSFGATKLLFGKSLEGSSACFLGVFISSYSLTGNIKNSFILALTVTVVEILPLKDIDNIVIPVLAGFGMLFLDLLSVITKLVLFV